MSAILRRTVRFTGHVQGVGFRYTAKGIADGFDVVGYVRNLSDGTVELVAEGAEAEINKLIDEIRRKMEGFVRHHTTFDSPPTGEFSDFSIAR